MPYKVGNVRPISKCGNAYKNTVDVVPVIVLRHGENATVEMMPYIINVEVLANFNSFCRRAVFSLGVLLET